MKNKTELIRMLADLAMSFDKASADFYEGIMVAIQVICEWETGDGE